MRILLVNKFHYLKGGSEKYYFELGKLLKEKGNEVAYFSMEDSKNISTGDKEYFVKPIDLNSSSKLNALSIIYSKENYKKMCKAIDDFKPDVIHLNNFQRQLSASIVKAAINKKIPIIFTTHDMQAICPNKDMLYKGENCNDCITKGYYSCVKKNCIKKSKLKSLLGVIEMEYYKKHKIYESMDCIFSPSNFMKQNLINGKLKYKRFEVIYNFVNDTNTTGVCNEKYILYFGRLSIEKGIYNLLKAIKDIPDSRLKIAGTGPEKDNIVKFIKDNNLEKQVELLGFVEPNNIRDYIKKCSFVVVPSIWYENCPYSILETLEIGKPVIGSNIGGIPELIEDGKNGYLYTYSNYEELVDKIKKLYKNDVLIEKMSNESRKKYLHNFSSDIYYSKIMELYHSVKKENKNV